jgi:cytochrome c
LLLVLASLACACGKAADRGSADAAVALVKMVVADLRKHEREKVIQDVQNQAARYRDRDLYIVIGTLEGVSVANGSNPKLAGKNVIDIRDADGVFFVRERIALAKNKGAGWHTYRWLDPISKQMQKKSMYVERYENLIVGCGIYLD